MDKKIWVLGTKNDYADRSFLWSDKIEGIADADIIIIDLNTLTRNNLDLIEDKIEYLNYELAHKLNSTSQLICILQTSEEFSTSGKISSRYLLPINIELIKSDHRKTILFNKDNEFYSNYLKNITYVDYFLENISLSKIYFNEKNLLLIPNNEITDNSVRLLGGVFTDMNSDSDLSSHDYYNDFLPITLLPLIDDPITKIISILKKSPKDSSPTWIQKILVNGLDDINKQLKQNEQDKQELIDKIDLLNNEKNNLSSYTELLYTQGKQLEEIVKDAFKLLGFNDIQRTRPDNKEDWLIDLHLPNFELGVIEVKGKNKRSDLSDMRQCVSWADDYLEFDPSKYAKGIFVVNQFRLDKFPESKSVRKHFEPNELIFAKTRDICILPTFVLFEAVNKVLSGIKPDRKKLEKLIGETNGVLDSLL